MNQNDTTPISLFDEIKIQTKVLVPLLRKMRKELGKQKADDLLGEALRQHVRETYHKIGKRKSGSPMEKWRKVWDEIRPRIGDDVERDILRDDDTGRIYNVNRCKFADFFRELGEPELGTMLMCDFDYYIAEIGAPVVELTRTQTIMEGADHCDFCYRFRADRKDKVV